MIANIFKMLLVTVVCGIFALILWVSTDLFLISSVGLTNLAGIVVIFVFLIIDAIVFVTLIIVYIVRTIRYMNEINSWVIDKAKNNNDTSKK
jgi:hypothetical protein